MSQTTQSDQTVSTGSAVKSFLAGLKSGFSITTSSASSAGAEDKFFSDLIEASQKYAADVSQQAQARDLSSKDDIYAASRDTAQEPVQENDYKEDRRKDRNAVDSKHSADEKVSTKEKSIQEDGAANSNESIEESIVDASSLLSETVVTAEDANVVSGQEAVTTAEAILAAISEEVSTDQTGLGAEENAEGGDEISQADRENMEKAMLLFLQGLQSRKVEDSTLKAAEATSEKPKTDEKETNSSILEVMETTTEEQDASTNAETAKTSSLEIMKKGSQKTESTSSDEKQGQDLGAMAQNPVLADATEIPSEERGVVRRHDEFTALLKETENTTAPTNPQTNVSAAVPSQTAVAFKNALNAEAGTLPSARDLASSTAKAEASSSTPVIEGTPKTGSYNFASQLSATRAARGGSTGLPSAVEQVALFLNKNAKNSQGDQLTLQLKPAELGRIDIKLSISSDQQVKGTVIADSQATLDLLTNDSSALERALQNAGLQADAGCLQFSLRGDGQSGLFHKDSSSSSKSNLISEEKDSSVLADLAIAQEAYYVTPERVNLRV